MRKKHIRYYCTERLFIQVFQSTLLHIADSKAALDSVSTSLLEHNRHRCSYDQIGQLALDAIELCNKITPRELVESKDEFFPPTSDFGERGSGRVFAVSSRVRDGLSVVAERVFLELSVDKNLLSCVVRDEQAVVFEHESAHVQCVICERDVLYSV